MEWIKGEQLPDGSVKIKGQIYGAPGTTIFNGVEVPASLTAEYVVKDGWVFRADWNHSGAILMTERVAKKWGMDDCRMDPEEHAEEVELMGIDPKFTHELCINHVGATVNGDGEEVERDSPFGDPYLEPFVAWYHDIDPKFFSDLPEEDQDEVHLKYWCDG